MTMAGGGPFSLPSVSCSCFPTFLCPCLFALKHGFVFHLAFGFQFNPCTASSHRRKGISAPITLVDLHQETAGTTGRWATTDGYGQAKVRYGIL